jgi:hypothetical protein
MEAEACRRRILPSAPKSPVINLLMMVIGAEKKRVLLALIVTAG